MAGERTEKATPKRRSQARGKGQIAKSADFDAAVMLSIGVTLLLFFVPSIVDKLESMAIHIFTHLDSSQINRSSFITFFAPYGTILMSILLPFMLGLMFSGLLLKRIQVGHLFTLEAIKPNFGKLSPASMISGFKRYVDLRSMVELVKSLVKMLIIAATCIFRNKCKKRRDF